MGKEYHCPNCGAAAVAKDDGSLVCSKCGGTFTFQEGEAHLAGVGEYDKLKGDVDQLKGDVEGLKAGKPDKLPPATPDGDPDPETPDEDPNDYEDPEDEDDEF
jgi:uncharacterized Zn finger protein (UPF0148 family)